MEANRPTFGMPIPQVFLEGRADMELVRYGRLSVQSVKKAEFDRVKRIAGL